jgi:peptidoglycan/LPS O-acetylase OafA/YrhL
MKRLVYIDSLRGIASLIVAVFWHYQHFSSSFQPNAIGDIPPLYNFLVTKLFFTHGDVMVDLFFTLSGVIFCYTYRTAINQSTVSGYEFLMKRFSRLYPVHILTLILAAILASVFFAKTNRFPLSGHFDTYNFDTYHFILNLAFIQKGFLDAGYSFNVPAWSLSIEAFMYLLFFIQSRFKHTLYSSVFLVVIGLIIFRMHYNFAFLINEPIARGLIGFFTGCILYEVLIEQNIYRQYRWLIIIFYVLTIAFYWIYLSRRISLPPNLIMIYLAVILIAELHHNKPMRLLLDNKLLIVLGDISLSVYLIHVPIQFAILLYFEANHLPIIYSDPLFFMLYGLSVVGVGWLLHTTVEKPTQSWLRLRMKKNLVQSV